MESAAVLLLYICRCFNHESELKYTHLQCAEISRAATESGTTLHAHSKHILTCSFGIPGLEQDAGQRGIAWFVLRQHNINGKLDTVLGFDIAGLHNIDLA